MIDINGTLYGHTGVGGTYGGGVFFTMTPSGREDVFYNLTPSDQGSNPFMQLGNALYGTIGEGYGAFFRLSR